MAGLALFDLDNTLLAGDSDARWGEYLVEIGVLDAETQGRANDQFYQDYLAGCLDVFAFLRFAFAVLKAHPMEQLLAWREGYLREKIHPIVLDQGKTLLDRHRAQGHTLVIVTATNSFLTRPIADLLGVEHLIASEPELREGRFTGEVAGTPSFGPGKVTRLDAWIEAQDTAFSESWFYSDSHNDLPLLRRVDHPVAVDPDDTLRQAAVAAGWPVMSLRG